MAPPRVLSEEAKAHVRLGTAPGRGRCHSNHMPFGGGNSPPGRLAERRSGPSGVFLLPTRLPAAACCPERIEEFFENGERYPLLRDRWPRGPALGIASGRRAGLGRGPGAPFR